jgi:hypothetical protein
MVIDDMVFNNMVSAGGDTFSAYTGTLPLDINEFPMVPDVIEKGKESNIYTRTMGVGDLNDPNDNRVMLIPQMRHGKLLSEEEIDLMISRGEHFGIYNSEDEANWIDSYIHDEFQKQKNGR